MKRIIFIIIAIFVFNDSYSQIGKKDFYGGLGFNGTVYLTGNGLAAGSGMNLRGGLNISPKIGAVIGFNTSFPVTFKSDEYAYAMSSLIDPSTLEYTSVHKVNFYDLNIRGNIYLAGNADNGVGFYAQVGASILGYRDKVQTSPYDHSLYYSTNEGDASIGMMLGGVGLQYRAGLLAVFFEFGLNLPANQLNGQDVSPIAVFNAGGTLGVKIYLGKADTHRRRMR